MIPVALVSLVEGWLGPRFAKLAKPLLIGVGAVLLCLAMFAAVKIHDHRVVKAHDAQIEVKTLQAQRQANDQAAAQRSTDVITQAKNEQEAHSAIAAQPDQPIAPTSRALGCQRLQRAGKDISKFPACSGPASGH